jgi:hypothetical protein
MKLAPEPFDEAADGTLHVSDQGILRWGHG